MLARFFVDRPVFAWVIALGIALAGLMALRALPIENYPTVAPPSLTIGVTYPGADAQTLEQNATQIIEQELNGVEGFLYMASTSQSNGTATITLTFQAGTDLDVAQTEVQNRLTRVEQRLPEEVRRQGIIVNKASSGFLMVVALTSKSGTMSALELGNVANAQILDELRRVNGVGDLRLFGSEYAMRIWLDPDKLVNFKLSAAEALAAVQEQNSQTAGGQIGDQPPRQGHGAERHDHHPKPLHQPAAVREHHPARQSGRIDRPPGRCRPGRTRRADLCQRQRTQRQADGRHRRADRARRQRARHRQGRAGEDEGA